MGIICPPTLPGWSHEWKIFESIICRNNELSWTMSWVSCLITDSSATRLKPVKRMGTTEILRRIWLFSANQIKSSEFLSKQPTQLIVELNSSLRQIIDSQHLFSATQHAVLTWIIQFQEDVPKACSNVLVIKSKDYQWKKCFQLHNLITIAEIC